MKDHHITTFVRLIGVKAILAMPFFDENTWMKSPKKVWVWAVLTFPATALAVLFYIIYTRKGLVKKTGKDFASDDVEMDALDSDDEDQDLR